MTYLYFFNNVSLTLRVVEYLRSRTHFPLRALTVIHQMDGWIMQISLYAPLGPGENADLCAFLREMGNPLKPSSMLGNALNALNSGCSPVEIMRRHQIAIVSHGRPDCDEIEDFRRQFVRGLGYCPETLA